MQEIPGPTKGYTTPGRKCAASASIIPSLQLVCYHRRRISGVLAPFNCLRLISNYYQFACAPPPLKLDTFVHGYTHTVKSSTCSKCPLFSEAITWTIDKVTDL